MLVKYRSRSVRSWASNSGPATVRLCYRATRVERKYAKEFSHALGRDMELLHFGSGGRTLLVFPTSQGRFYQWEDFGIVDALAPGIDSRALQLDPKSTRLNSSHLVI